jgi:hypothetical protein
MTIYINGNQANITLDTEKTLEEVLSGLDRELSAVDAVITDIELDGDPLTQDNMDEAMQKDISLIQSLALRVVTAGEVQDALKALCGELQALAERLEDVPVQLQSGKPGDAAKALRDAAQTIQTFCFYSRVMDLFSGADGEVPRFDALLVDGNPQKDFFAELIPVLQDFCNALETGDIVMTGDLAEYEIKPRLSALAAALENWQ